MSYVRNEITKTVNVMQAILAELRKQRRAACNCDTTDDWYIEFDENHPEADRCRFRDVCGKCLHQEDHVYTREQFTQAESLIR